VAEQEPCRQGRLDTPLRPRFSGLGYIELTVQKDDTGLTVHGEITEQAYYLWIEKHGGMELGVCDPQIRTDGLANRPCPELLLLRPRSSSLPKFADAHYQDATSQGC
jgi:hypothetical protein